MSPEEKRGEYPDSFNAVTIGVYDHWREWWHECERLDQNLNWLDFFDGCFCPAATGESVTMTINREKYYPVKHNRHARRVLEQALFNVLRIPFKVYLKTTEGV